jgi:hypothetical protein
MVIVDSKRRNFRSNATFYDKLLRTGSSFDPFEHVSVTSKKRPVS